MQTDIKYPYWINTSIFYNSNESHLLIRQFIKPFIDEMQRKKLLNDYFVYFSSDRGENVRLLLGSKNHSMEVGHEFDCSIHSFLNKNQSKDITNAAIPFHFFMNFPNNSVHYELYNHDFNISTAAQRQITCVLRIITRMILDHLSDEPIDLASLFTAITYLHVSLFRSYSLHPATAESAASMIINQIEKKSKTDSASAGEAASTDHSKFFTDPEIFREIKDEIWALDIDEFNNFYDWGSISKYFISKPASFVKSFHFINNYIFFYLNVPAYIQNSITVHVLKNSFQLAEPKPAFEK